MQAIITNDDGIDAEGIQALVTAASEFFDPIVIAPADHQSGCSHAVTTGKDVKVESRGEHRFAVYGTPADCVRIGLSRLAPQAKIILSGINHGGNLGADVYYSGTVAAVREGVLHGWPGIAFSYYRRKGIDFDWVRASKFAKTVLKNLIAMPEEIGTLWNVNFPHLDADHEDPELVFCPLDHHPLPLSFRHGEDGYLYNGDYHSRKRISDGDVNVCFSGRIAITKIKLF